MLETEAKKAMLSVKDMLIWGTLVSAFLGFAMSLAALAGARRKI